MKLRTCFKDIQQEIITCLSGAEKRIHAAVAWLTDERIAHALLQAAAKRNVSVELIINDDEINRKASHLLDILADNGVRIHFFDPAMGLMHHKFCIIDERMLITGSYNWTYSAANRNQESIVIIEDESQSLELFSQEFRQMKAQLGVDDGGLPILSPETYGSRAELFMLDAEISILTGEKADLEFTINEFEILIKKAIGGLISRKLYLEKILHEIIARQTRKKEDVQASVEKENRYREYEELLEKALKLEIPNLEQDMEQDLKKMFRECMMMTHPDRFVDEPQKETEATEIAAALNEAYMRRDYDRVRQIWDDLKSGIAFKSTWFSSTDAGVISKLIQKLRLRRDALIQEIDELKSHFVWRVREQYKSYDQYFEVQREQIEMNIMILENEIKIRQQ